MNKEKLKKKVLRIFEKPLDSHFDAILFIDIFIKSLHKNVFCIHMHFNKSVNFQQIRQHRKYNIILKFQLLSQ